MKPPSPALIPFSTLAHLSTLAAANTTVSAQPWSRVLVVSNTYRERLEGRTHFRDAARVWRQLRGRTQNHARCAERGTARHARAGENFGMQPFPCLPGADAVTATE